MKYKFYVYRLIDPITDCPFYIGKGSGDRVAAHEREALAGKPGKKTQKIRDIWAKGLQVKREIVAYFKDEAEAYLFEADLITQIGLEYLTNILPGGCGGISSRRQGSYIEYKGLTALGYAKLLVKSGAENLLALYLKLSEGGTKDFNVTLKSRSSVELSFHQVAFQLIQSAWKQISSSKEALDFIEPALIKHGVRFDYGC